MSGRVDAGSILSLVGLVFVAFVGGAFVMLTETFPAGLLRDAHRAAGALYEQEFRYRDPLATDLWNPARSDRRGVTLHDPLLAQTGYTLYTSGHAATAVLVDMAGDVVHQWTRPYSTVWDETAAARNPVPDDHVYFRKAQALPDGRLLALYEGVGDSPYGYGAVMLSAESQVLWRNLAHLHHDFDLTPDGRVVTLGHAYRTTPLPHADQFEPPYTEDSLVFLDADGRTLSSLSLLDALNESEYRSLLWRIPYYSMEDPLHANGVDYLDTQRAAWLSQTLPMAAEGQVLVSFRELAGGSVALVDPEAGRVVWASRGPWLAQHDPDILPAGTLQVFDNRGNLNGFGRSRIIEVDPSTGGIVWRYVGTAATPLDSTIRASQQRLANGNTLITESVGGRLLEVTAAGDVVWEYVNPVRGGESEALIPVVSWGQRLPGETFEPVFAAALERAGQTARAAGR